MPYPVDQQNMIQINSLVDLAAIGGFNPNKYMTPMPEPVMMDGMPLPPHVQLSPEVSAFTLDLDSQVSQNDPISPYPDQFNGE